MNMTTTDTDAAPHRIWTRLYRGETSYDFVGKRRRWFAVSGTIILIGIVSMLFRGFNFGIEFKGGTVWEVKSDASVAHVRDVVGGVSPDLRQATISILTNRQTGARTIEVKAKASATTDKTKVTGVVNALAKMANTSPSQVTLQDVGPSWGHDITQKAERALVIFLLAIVIYITFRFEGKMAIAALVALVHDLLVTAGIYSLSGFQVTPDTVIAFLTILGYSLYDTIVVFDKVEENTKGLASTGRITYTDTVNLSMNQVLMRSINTSLVALMPVVSILFVGAYLLGATSLQDFGLALFIGLMTGAYSSIFIASPVLAVLKEREPRYSQIRQRLAARAATTGPLTPAAAASGRILVPGDGAGRGAEATRGGNGRSKAKVSAADAELDGNEADEVPAGAPAGSGGGAVAGGRAGSGGAAASRPRPQPANRGRPAPRPRKKGRRR